MSEYKLILCDVQVPKEWPVETERLVITKLVRKGIWEHPFGQRVVITINDISALITGGWPMYTLERIERESDEYTRYIDLFLPVKISMSKFQPDRSSLLEKNSELFLSEDLTFDHPISRLFGSTGHRIAIATPNLLGFRSILRRMDVTGEDAHNYTCLITYRNPKGLVPQQFVQATSDTCVSVEKITEAEWNIVYAHRLIKPQHSWCNRNIVQPLKRSPLFRRR